MQGRPVPKLELTAVTKRFGAKAAVRDASLVVPAGQFVGVIGRSGAGKSTLLRMINRLIEPTSGRITFERTEVTSLRGVALLDWRQSCAMIFQQFNLALAGLPAVGGLPGAIRLASRNPARAVGLEDRGEIAAGKRADLTRIAVVGERPVVREVFVRGLRVA